jgi:hypothetical protein
MPRAGASAPDLLAQVFYDYDTRNPGKADDIARICTPILQWLWTVGRSLADQMRIR